MLKPHPALLKKWRLQLVLAAWIFPFLFGVFFRPGTFWWIVVVSVWLVLFIAAYLWYLPARYRNLSFAVRENGIELTSGVFTSRVRSIPLDNIQFTTRAASPSDMLFRLSSLVVTAPGGKLTVPGLSKSDARALAGKLTGGAR